MTDDDPTLWWGQPLDARRFHVFEGESSLAQSLCGSWRFGYHGDDPEVDPEGDSWRDGEDCKECCRQAGVLQEGEDS
jgi:hypothetical protein